MRVVRKSNSGYILKVEPTGFSDRSDVMYNRKRGGEYDFINFGFSNYKKWESPVTDRKTDDGWSRSGGRERQQLHFEHTNLTQRNAITLTSRSLFIPRVYLFKD